jgi:uncharacterized membrane protein YbjE (DUF340 family)
MLLPFMCLAAGILVGIRNLSKKVLKIIDNVTNLALVTLMSVIGVSIGSDSGIIRNLANIGFHCLVIALLAIAFSVLCTLLVEKTLLPLDKVRAPVRGEAENEPSTGEPNTDEKTGSALVWIIPGSVIAGVLLGFFLIPEGFLAYLDFVFTASLVVLYLSVGVSQGANKSILGYVKSLGFRIVFLPLAILAGSLAGGIVAGFLLPIPMELPVMAAGGMSFYSLTGAYMTQAFGVKSGTYGFIVNVLREFITVLSMPLLIKISKGSPIAGGAAGNMDTMLAPVTKFVGAELGLVTLFTGTVLTFIVPFLLPALYTVFN